jgi:thiamine-phosphate pyrophosphorylase
VVCDAEVCERAGWTLPNFAAACLDGGARLLQVRAKAISSRGFLAAVSEILRRAEPYNSIVVVNDRADIARLAGAQGVHVGQDDLTPSDVRTIVGEAAFVGLSTHTADQLRSAVSEPVDYVAIGPVFGTTTKDTGHNAVGLGLVTTAVDVMNARVPVVAIGGITLDRAPDVLAAGASSVAVITDLLVGNDPAARVRTYLARLTRV